MATKKEETKSVGFQLLKITTEQFAIIQEAYDSSIAEVGMNINLAFGIDQKQRVIASMVKVHFEQKEKPFLLLEIGHHYKIEQTAWNGLQIEEGKFILPRGFAAHLVMLTIGTLRGMLHCKTESTELNKFLLPTINVMELIKDDVELGVEK